MVELTRRMAYFEEMPQALPEPFFIGGFHRRSGLAFATAALTLIRSLLLRFLGLLLLLFLLLLTALPWYLAGLTLYLLTAWICLEPTWKRRLANLLIAVGVCRIFFLSDTPQAYDGMLPWLALLLVCSLFFPLLSVYRFKQGCQD